MINMYVQSTNNETAEKDKNIYYTLPYPIICSGFPARRFSVVSNE